MSRKLKGFSLAELLISLLVISIVLSAAIPTITKRTSQDREQIWKWSTDNNSTYFGLGSSQAVLIGTQTMPTGEIQKFMDDDNDSTTNNYNELYINNARFTTNGDKLAILKQSLHGQKTNMANSHISFYNIDSGVDRNTSNITYGGRIAVDTYNLAFGKGTLLHLEDPDKSSNRLGENTALGHFALMSTTEGNRNVAVGGKTLSHNKKGSYNTSLGYLAANRLGSTDRVDTRNVKGSDIREKEINGSLSSENTAIGYSSLGFNETGFGNTSVGSASLATNYYGDDNSAIGYSSLGLLEKGYGNTAVGANACNAITEGNYNICIGNAVLSEKTADNFSLSIGSTPTPKIGSSASTYIGNIQHSIPLITGHTQPVGITASTKNPDISQNNAGIYDKELIVNAKRFVLKPFNGGNYPTFIFTSVPGDIHHTNQTGYGDGNTSGISGTAYFNLKYVPGATGSKKSDSVSMQFQAVDNHAVIGTFNPSKVGTYNGKKAAAYKDISLNQVLRFDMPFKYSGEANPMNKDAGRMQEDSNIIDLSAAGLIRSTKYKVGILGEFVDREAAKSGTINYNDTFELLLNSKVNVSRVAAHVINVDEFGTQIRGDKSNPKPFDIVLDDEEDTPNFRVEQTRTILKVPADGVTFFNEGSTFTDYILKIAPTHIEAQKDILINGLTNTAGLSTNSLINALKGMNTEINNLKSYHSDARLKNISGDSTAGLAEINQLEVKNYTYKKDEKKTPHVGVIAQQLQKVFPNSVIEDEEGYLRIKTEEIFFAMVNSIKELCAKLQDLTAKVVGLDKRITELEAQNKMLLEQNKAFEKRLEKLEKQAAK